MMPIFARGPDSDATGCVCWNYGCRHSIHDNDTKLPISVTKQSYDIFRYFYHIQSMENDYFDTRQSDRSPIQNGGVGEIPLGQRDINSVVCSSAGISRECNEM